MFSDQRPRRILHTPKVFQAPREEEKKVFPKIITFLIVFIIIVSGLTYLFLFSSVFVVKNIEVVGSPSDEVKQKLEDLKGKNIFSFNANTLEAEIIRKNQNYLSVRVFRGLPDTVRVKFQDREAKIIWQTQNQEYYVDKDAVLFQVAGESSLPKVLDTHNLSVEIPTQVATASFIEFIKSAESEVEKLNLKVTQFEVEETTFQIDAVTDQGFVIIFDTLRPLSEQIDALSKVLETDRSGVTEYIDLRVEGWVYYK